MNWIKCAYKYRFIGCMRMQEGVGCTYAKFENYVYINTIHTYDMYMDELIRE